MGYTFYPFGEESEDAVESEWSGRKDLNFRPPDPEIGSKNTSTLNNPS